ncbi:MAG: PEGA domain-containing protein [Phycisphaerae bacterium]
MSGGGDCGLARLRGADADDSHRGALVYLNDEEAGRTPVTVPFTWYGDYDVVIRKDGYKTLRTHHRLRPPWYQLPPIDLVAEALVPVTIRDRREVSFALERQVYPDRPELLERASQFRQEALYGQE